MKSASMKTTYTGIATTALLVLFSFTKTSEAQTGFQSQPLLLANAPQCAVQPQGRLRIDERTAAKVGRQVWLNETGGKREMITAWNASEDFASLGIGHFIWFSAGLQSRFVESFPTMMTFLRGRGATLPKWLDKSNIPPSPWKTKAQFQRDFYKPRLSELRDFLLRTKDIQAQFLVRRLESALPKLLAALSLPRERIRVRCQFYRVVRSSPDLYPLIDYVNFKGEGVESRETFPNKKTGKPEGWGLKHVLLAMKETTGGSSQVLHAFSDAARLVLLRRISNNPRDQRWRKGWLARVKTYRYPLR